MARLQILELPEGSNDDRPPFVLVIDQYEGVALEMVEVIESHWKRVGQEIGASGTLIFMESVNIPANDTTAYREQVAEEIRYAQGKVTRELDGPRLADERTGIARDIDRLANHKAALLDALGMDPTRDWDDIRNAARGLRKQRDAQAEAIERVRQLHKPVIYRDQEICWDCSAYDFVGQTTDNPPIAYSNCGTQRALNGEQEQP